jgi:Photosynthetic reaction centre cytochrome C subunit
MMASMRLFISLLFVLLPLCAQPPQEPPKKGGGGRGPRNLKILTVDDLRSGAMMKYTQALGVKCDHCHIEDRASDDNPKKLVARNMIQMVKDINAKFPDASKTYVTCYTCHNGHVTPMTTPPPAAPAAQ